MKYISFSISYLSANSAHGDCENIQNLNKKRMPVDCGEFRELQQL
jgi:hypothetical protein